MSTEDRKSEESLIHVTEQAPPCIEIVEVEDILARPDADRYLILTKDIERPCFRIVAGKLEPVKRTYNVSLRNTVQLSAYDELHLVLKIPSEIAYYEIPSSIQEYTLDAVLSFDSEEGCVSVKSELSSAIEYNCGWVTFNLVFTIPSNDTETYNKICNLQYSMCFPPTELVDKRVACEVKPHETVFKYRTEACLYVYADQGTTTGAGGP